jgi:hypothetical protein
MAESNEGQKPSGASAAESKAGPPAPPTKKNTKRKKAAAKRKRNTARKDAPLGSVRGGAPRGKYPRQSILNCIRIPQAIIDQNAGEACTDREGAGYAKIGWGGDIAVEISSAIKYGLLQRPSPDISNPQI